MSDLFQPIAAKKLFDWVFSELETRNSIFGIPRRHFFEPAEDDTFRTTVFGQALETPFGPAAGPHSQMAQNIVAAWLCGARYIELKTVQTLDVLDVSKPCIDMEDEGYNVEWSQELRIHQSFEEYLRAWVLIHVLHRLLGFPGTSPGVVFNLSVGYDLQGIQQPNMQWFLDRVADCAEDRDRLVCKLARHVPDAADIRIPARLSDNVTLSTMHGCPPDEIGAICRYLMRERGLHTYVKCNPTLLGPERVRRILHERLGFTDAIVPDEAFEHDLAYDDALPLLQGLQETAAGSGLEFGVKLTNTLPVKNFRQVFSDAEEMMYLSGRPLHAITVKLAADLARDFSGSLPMSFSAGADCFNTPALLAGGMQTVTVCSDLLKTGGYLRLLQYLENTARAIRSRQAASLEEFILNSAGDGSDARSAALRNLEAYAASSLAEPRLRKGAFLTSRGKTGRKLGLVDCIRAPCVDQCPVDQKVPQYMEALREGDLPRAARLARQDNPLAAMLGRVCDHLCEPVCVRTHLDEPLAIRHVKRYIMEHEEAPQAGGEGHEPSATGPGRVAIIGAGPGGIAAAAELSRAGLAVEIFEKQPYPGGMVGGAIPAYRLPPGAIDQDLALLEQRGVNIHYGVTAGRDLTLSDLRRDGFDRVVIMTGAQLGKTLGLEGEDCEGVIDALHFLRRCREGRPVEIGRRIGVIGAGDTAMDCARTAWRLSAGKEGAHVTVIYRRTTDQMPADREEVACLLEEGIEVVELARPQELRTSGGRLESLVCRRMEYRGDRDDSGRKIPHEIPGSDFEIPLDGLILAISQNAMLDFFGDEPVAVNRRGYIETDPRTRETSVSGVYAGGDVADDGPSSIVEAAADGKAIANGILGRREDPVASERVMPFETAELIGRRARRQWRVPVAHVPVEQRKNFDEVVRGYSEEQACREAARCLDCHRYCSLCVGVCPNLALQTLQVDPAAHPGVRQAYQIAVLADLCNECGNCTTFCPTAGEPYRDKPRLYVDRDEFLAQRNNAFRVFQADGGGWNIEGRFEGETIALRGGKAGKGEQPGSPAATMQLLLSGVEASLPWLPVADEE